MFRKLLRVAVFVGLCIALGTSVAYFAIPASKVQGPATNTLAVKVAMPVDLTGKWESAESKVGTKFIATVENNTVFVEMTAADGFSGLWYGTFDILQPGQKSISSKALNDPNRFVLSSAETKDFVYQDGSLVFNYSVMGTRTTIEMKRV